MRHGKKVNHLGRTDSHRKAMLANMATSLIKHKRITTTLAKAKALRTYVEPLITKSKNDTTHSRRTVFAYLKDKDAVTILFREVSEKVASRPGGYTRIIKLENRLGDNAEMAFIELVDYNEVYGNTAKTEKKSTRRRATTKKKATETEAKAAVAKADDLTIVEGIGPKIAEVLTAAGIATYADLAKSDAEKVKEILTEAGSNFNTADPATWAEQAQLAADGKFEELEKLKAELDSGKKVDE
ncbi:50S ribosomal protein L17 [Sphingobacterium sp. DK4209]|uniref:Large ribosomal subunit protein bL17 n=1 Tax=Sphingobacterium zhuxiongii TaxID=2662364 RepID=A0A5Q0QDI7_9SPHI|nr:MULTISPECIES: 50S ribosomal protein L17 [unclassified Sphingobacterium]MVZ65969.1 50S ribosomal protein L17 [Sphingobacterium sp. DK4209]QGA27573.1 50S ribosomal protein L17 [Sphingobacterium sp. dk4302]